MLLLHNTYRKVFSASVFLIIFLASCSDKSGKNLAIMKTLEESLVTSSKMLSASSADILTSLQNKLADPSTSQFAKMWYPKAQMIQAISTEAYNYIERIIKQKAFKKMFKDDTSNLYQRLVAYRTRLLQVDPRITKTFERSLRIFTSEIDSANDNQKEMLKIYFSGVSIEASEAMLVKLQNNIRFNEERITTFCHEQIATHPLYPVIYAIAIQNKSIVQPGEQIEVYAGLGRFSADIKTEVFVYDNPVQLDGEAVAIYKLAAASRPGKYYVPVKIKYIDQDGKQQTIQKEIEYTVANIQKQ